ncbi:MAG: site-specific DNA-methyltransferase [Anaerolineales bacterium]
MASNFEKLQTLLSELFQLDQADLDFGIYRIMNQKRGEITHFLDQELLPQVKTAFAQYHPVDKKVLEEKLEQARQAAVTAGFDPEQSPRVKEVREQIAAYSVDTTALENEVYSHLYSFFRRYYDNGDFISMRRYKEGVYAIPYEGEEVKLHWANADQYYIKTAEYFRDYTFKLPSGRAAHFKIVEAETEKDNVKAPDDKDRRFILASENPVLGEAGALVMRFEYRTDPEKRDQKTLNQMALTTIVANALAEWQADLAALTPSEADANRTLLQKYLQDYTARNTFDYFIHKDLRGFLRRELDFYIKNEVMRLDDIESEGAPQVEQYLSKIKVLRRIAHKIIEFLAQIEDFQKKLWLKKKFVVETNYCITLDRVPEALYQEICANAAQREEWVRLFAIDDIKGDLVTPGYSIPLTIDFLKTNPFLVVDTRFFAPAFKEYLLASLENIDEQLNGLLINSENFQALQLIRPRFHEKVKSIYIDPPYNTGDDGFVYKDEYLHSSWLTMLSDRLVIAKEFLDKGGSIAISIDFNEVSSLLRILDIVFGVNNRASIVSVKRGSVTGHKAINPGVVNVTEYVVIYSREKILWSPNRIFKARDRNPRYDTFIKNRDKDISQWQFCSLLDAFAEYKGIQKSKLKKQLGDKFEDEIWQFLLRNPDSVVQLAYPDFEKVSKDAQDIILASRKDKDKVFLLQRGNDSDMFLLGGLRILFYRDRLMTIDGQLTTGEPLADLWDDTLPNDLHNEGGVSLKKGKKPEKLLKRVMELCSNKQDLVMDFFVGSGTFAAVAQKGSRFFIGIESESYFDSLTKRRLINTLHGEQSGVSKDTNWKGGGFFKYLHLESFEDTLNNLMFNRNAAQQMALGENPGFRESYLLSYMLEAESQQAQLNTTAFVHPFTYQLNIATGTVGETKPTIIDLVETFNYLIGLRVQTMQSLRGFKVITGLTPDGERTLIIWRDLAEKTNAELDEFFRKQDYNPRDMEFDLIYVNGDNNLENLRRPDETWKVRLIEEEFLRRMFDAEGM